MLEQKMQETKEGLNSYSAHNPFMQVAFTLGLILILGLLSLGLKGVAPNEMGNRFPWITSTAMILLFAVFNAVFGLMSAYPQKYWNRSILGFIALVGFTILFASGISGIPLAEAGSFRFLLIVVTFCYLVFIAITNSIKTIVAFAQKEEWNAPRQKNRK
jgi:drug/metabolite transporter (DMT)-like permease